MWIDLDRKIIDFDLIDYHGTYQNDLNSIHFPMGEEHIRLPDVSYEIEKGENYASVFSRIRNSEDLVQLLLLSNSLDKHRIEKRKLVIPYLPYARQDRVATWGDPHSLQVICDLLDNLGFKEIVVVDVHSATAEACFRKSKFTNYHPYNEFLKWTNFLFDPSQTTLISPDEGAIKRTSEFMKFGFKELVPCFKIRNPKTGELEGFEVSKKITTNEVVIVDDICDGGGTFLGLAPKLRGAGANRLFLWVTHGGFTKGTNKLLEEFNEIGCTNSYRYLFESERLDQRITQISINFKEI